MMVDLLTDEQIEWIKSLAERVEEEVREPDMPISPPDDGPVTIDREE